MDKIKIQKKSGEGRSPAFPFIPLEKALGRCKELLDVEGKNWVPLSSAIHAWKYSEKSTGGRLTASALRYFGLINDKGTKLDRRLRVSESAWSILKSFDENDLTRLNLIKEVALAPKIHAVLWNEYKNELPSDKTLLTNLVRDRNFTESGAKALIKEYKDTITFANLAESDKLFPDDEGNGNNNGDNGNPSLKPPKGGRIPKVDENIAFGRSWDLMGGITATLNITGIPPQEEKEFLELCIGRAMKELFEQISLSNVDEPDDENQE